MTLARTSQRRYGDALMAALFVVAGTALAVIGGVWPILAAAVAVAAVVAAVQHVRHTVAVHILTRWEPAAWPAWVKRSAPDRGTVLQRVQVGSVESANTPGRVVPLALARDTGALSGVTGHVVDSSGTSVTDQRAG